VPGDVLREWRRHHRRRLIWLPVTAVDPLCALVRTGPGSHFLLGAVFQDLLRLAEILLAPIEGRRSERPELRRRGEGERDHLAPVGSDVALDDEAALAIRDAQGLPEIGIEDLIVGVGVGGTGGLPGWEEARAPGQTGARDEGGSIPTMSDDRSIGRGERFLQGGR
jgi:hypothetical protein